MSSFRLISTLRSSLLTNKFYRRVFPLSGISSRSISSIDVYPCVPVRTQQICWFSSSAIVHARRRDKIDANVVEELDNEEDAEENADEDDNDSDQVILSFVYETI